MSLVTKPALLDETFSKAMRKQNALLEVIARDSIKTMSSDWGGLAELGSLMSEIYDYGDQFTDVWKDTTSGKEYTYPFQLNHFANVELEDGEVLEKRPFLQAHYAHPFGVQFSHQRAFLACPDGLSAGTYYFTIESNWGSNVSAGDIVCFTTTQDVPKGGRVSGCYSAPDRAKSDWEIYTHSADGKTVLETLTPVFTASGTDLGTQKYSSRNGNLNSTQEMAYGWNRWKYSALRQYLNSDADIGNWWTAQDEWDIAPTELTTKAGFLSGLPSEMIDVLKKVKVTTYTNTVQDGGEADITYDRVFLPSLEEVYVKPQIAGEGEYHVYWKRRSGATSPLAQYGNYPNMITYAVENHTSPQIVTLRSCNRSFSHYRCIVSSSGSVTDGDASASLRFAPLVVI